MHVEWHDMDRIKPSLTSTLHAATQISNAKQLARMNAICAQQHCKSHAISVLWIFSVNGGVYFLIFDLFHDFQQTQRISQSAVGATATAIHQICAHSLLFCSMVKIGIYTGSFPHPQNWVFFRPNGRRSFLPNRPHIYSNISSNFRDLETQTNRLKKKPMSIDNSLKIKENGRRSPEVLGKFWSKNIRSFKVSI